MKSASNATPFLKFKQHFKNLNYYSMPTSTLFVFRKRVHFILTILTFLLTFIFTIL